MKSGFFTYAAFVSALVIMGVAPPAASELSYEQVKAKLDKFAQEMDGNYVQIGKTRTGGLSEGQKTSFTQILRAGACYRFVAVGGVEAGDLDLRVFAKSKMVASDGGSVLKPTADYCAVSDVAADVKLQMYKGKGPYAFAVFARGTGESDVSSREAAALLDLKELALEAASGMEQIGEPVCGLLGHRNTEVLDVLLDRARCYKFIAAGGEGVQDLSLSLVVDGEEVASDRLSGKTPMVQWCSPGRVHTKVKLTMYGGHGPYAFGLYGSKKTGALSPEKVGGTESDFIANRIRQLHAQYGKGRAAVSAVFRGNLSTNNEQVFDVKLSAGHCYTIIGAGSPSAKDIDLILLNRTKMEIQRDKTRNGFPTMDTKPCPKFTGTYTIKVKMMRGFGQFGMQVFSD